MRKKVRNLLSGSLIKFLLVGGCSTGIDFIIYMVLSIKIQLTVAKGISMIISSIFSYIANKRFTFNNYAKTNMNYIIKYYMVFLANFITNLELNYLVFQFTGYKILAFISATLGGMAVNYLGQKLFVFKL